MRFWKYFFFQSIYESSYFNKIELLLWVSLPKAFSSFLSSAVAKNSILPWKLWYLLPAQNIFLPSFFACLSWNIFLWQHGVIHGSDQKRSYIPWEKIFPFYFLHFTLLTQHLEFFLEGFYSLFLCYAKPLQECHLVLLKEHLWASSTFSNVI